MSDRYDPASGCWRVTAEEKHGICGALRVAVDAYRKAAEAARSERDQLPPSCGGPGLRRVAQYFDKQAQEAARLLEALE